MRAGIKIAIVLALAGLVVAVTPVFASSSQRPHVGLAGYTGKIQNRVLSDTASGRESSFVVELTQQADLSRAYGMKDQDARGWFVYRTLKRTAEQTQAPIKAMLDRQGASYRSFWVANEIIVHSGGRPLVNTLAARPDVKVIEANDASNWLASTVGVELDSLTILKADRPDTIEPGVTQVKAPSLWAMGFHGEGIVVGNQDTGMRWTHNALKPHYRGWNGSSADHNYNWHDAIHSDISGNGTNPCGFDSQEPCDDQEHGTHTTGIATGDDGAGNQIGVAPGAKWIGCHNMDENNGRPETYTECFQWFIAPTDLNNQNPDPTKRPHVMNNSWGCPASELCAPNSLQTIVENTVASGIFVEVSAGNSGPSCSSVIDPPAIYDASYSTAAMNTGAMSIAGFSSRGPVTIDGSNRIKPVIAAPGIPNRSSISTSDSAYAIVLGHVDGRSSRRRRHRPALAGEAGARARHRRDGGAPEQHREPERDRFATAPSAAASTTSRTTTSGTGSSTRWPRSTVAARRLHPRRLHHHLRLRRHHLRLLRGIGRRSRLTRPTSSAARRPRTAPPATCSAATPASGRAPRATSISSIATTRRPTRGRRWHRCPITRH